MSAGRTVGTNELTARESEIYELVLQGCSNREIANLLGITRPTVRDHITELHAKLGSDGSRDSLRSGNGHSSGIFALLGGIAAVGSAAALGVGVLVFVVMNTGEPVDGNGPTAIVVTEDTHCAGELVLGGGFEPDDVDCAIGTGAK